jgi:hypothetical protein
MAACEGVAAAMSEPPWEFHAVPPKPRSPWAVRQLVSASGAPRLARASVGEHRLRRRRCGLPGLRASRAVRPALAGRPHQASAARDPAAPLEAPTDDRAQPHRPRGQAAGSFGRWVMTRSSGGERTDRSPRGAEAQRGNGTATAIPTSRPRSPLKAVSGWKLDLLLRDFARFHQLRGRAAVRAGGMGQPPAVISSWAWGNP